MGDDVMRPDFPCERCGEPQDAIDVSTRADAEPVYIVGMPCQCPRPRCAFCLAPVDADGRCGNIDCFFVGNLVPVPVMS